jgi:hypothetical protein
VGLSVAGALAAPRPLLLCNSDSDGIFPLDGVVRLRNKVRRVYDLLGAGEKCGLVITPGPHKDTQELQVPVMRWFNKHLKGEEPLVENAAVKLFTPQQLKVFEKLPSDAINTNAHFSFVEAARAEMPKTKEAWTHQRNGWLADLREKSFRAWSMQNNSPDQIQGMPKMTDGLVLRNERSVLSIMAAPPQEANLFWLELRTPTPGPRVVKAASRTFVGSFFSRTRKPLDRRR